MRRRRRKKEEKKKEEEKEGIPAKLLLLNPDTKWNIHSICEQMSNEKETKQLFLSNDLFLVYFLNAFY